MSRKLRRRGHSNVFVCFIHSAAYGGPHNQLAVLAETLPEFHFVAVLPDEPGDAADRLTAIGITVKTTELVRIRPSELRRPFRLLLKYSVQVAKLTCLLRQLNPSLVQTHGLFSFDAAIATRLAHAPLVWQVVDTRPPDWAQRIVGTAIRYLSDVSMTTGRSVAAHHNLLTSPRNYVFYPPATPVNAAGAAEARASARRLFAAGENEVVVGLIGNYNPQKAHVRMIQISELVGCPIEAFQVQLVGGAQAGHETYLSRVREAASHATARITLQVNPHQSGAELLAGIDILAVTSDRNSEGVPTVVLEAMATGIPIVTTDCGAVTEVVVDGVTGFVVLSEDLHLFAERLTQLVSDQPLRARIGSEGKRRYYQLFQPAEFVQVSRSAYQSVAG